MPRPKLDAKSDTTRVHMAIPSKLLKQIDAWRKRQTPIPNISESIRRLVLQGLEKERKR